MTFVVQQTQGLYTYACYILFGQKSHHDGVLRKLFPNFFDKLHKVFWVAIGHVQAYVLDERNGLQNAGQFFQIRHSTAWAGRDMLRTRR